MKLFFGQIFPDLILDLDEQLHITKVLRMREGEEIFVTDGKGNLAKGNLVFEGKKVSLDVSEIKENLPDLILLDWMLPGLSGPQFANRLRENKRTASG